MQKTISPIDNKIYIEREYDSNKITAIFERHREEIKGFVLNRLQVALLNEAFKLVEDGIVSGADLDKTIKHGLGLRWSIMGPMETIDLNAPGGIRDYLERFGPAFEAIAKEQSSIRPWDTNRYIKMEEERRKVMPINDLGERARWRERILSRHERQILNHPEFNEILTNLEKGLIGFDSAYAILREVDE